MFCCFFSRTFVRSKEKPQTVTSLRHLFKEQFYWCKKRKKEKKRRNTRYVNLNYNTFKIWKVNQSRYFTQYI